MDERRTIGWVGLGNLGRHMAKSVVDAGFDVIACDKDQERAEAFAAENGCRVAADPTGLASAEAVITMLPNGDVVREVVLESGLAEAVAAGTLFLDTSSCDPLATRALDEELRARSLHLVDAGVSLPEGGRAAERMITFMVGAPDDATFERATELLNLIGDRIFRMGPVGAGHVMKTLNNYVGGCALAASFDALAAGARYGLDQTTMLDVLNLSTGRNFNTEFPLKRAVAARYDSGFQIGLVVKDKRIAQRLAERTGFDSPMFALIAQLFAEVVETQGPTADHLRGLVHWEEREAPGAAQPAR